MESMRIASRGGVQNRMIERDRKQPVRRLLVLQRFFPDSILLDGVRQMPAAVKETEYLRAVRENPGLSVRRQNHADAASAQRRAHSTMSTNSTIRPARSTN